MLDLSQAWLRPNVRQVLDLRLPLVILILLGILLDAAATRMGVEPRLAPALAWVRAARGKAAEYARPGKLRWPKIFNRKPQAEEANKPADAPESPPPADDDARRRRFDRAKLGK